jgi:hypothetical protein
MHPYSDTGCEIVWLCVKPCQMCRVQTRTAPIRMQNLTSRRPLLVAGKVTLRHLDCHTVINATLVPQELKATFLKLTQFP